MKMIFDPGFDIRPVCDPMGFEYGGGIFGPPVENRSLDAIRGSLRDPDAEGPPVVYSIAMDVGKNKDRADLVARHLLYGVVMYAAGRLGDEPIRSQGHIHKVSPLSGMSTPEVYEIWAGRAVIYMQESGDDDPGRCFAVEAGTGEVVVVPPGWTHATVSADADTPLVFGAWCDRAYGFEYDKVRRHRGIAWFPVFDACGKLTWERNPEYRESVLTRKSPADYSRLGIRKGEPIYTTYENNPETFMYVPHPDLKKDVWTDFVP